VSCDLLLPSARVCFLPFEQFIEQQMVGLQDSILEHLHHHTLSNMLSNRISGPIVFEFYHVLALEQAFDLQLNQPSQPFNYLCHFFFTMFQM